MGPRIPYRNLASLAQRRPAARCFPTRPGPTATPSTAAAACRRRLQPLQPFSASQHRPQEPHHQQSTAAATPTPEPPPPSGTGPPKTETESKTKAKTKTKKKRRLLSAGVFLLIGAAAGTSARLLVSPPAPPEPGTAEDARAAEVLREQAARLPVVRRLGADAAWEAWDAYESLAPAHRARHVSAGALGGARGVGGYQRVFYRRPKAGAGAGANKNDDDDDGEIVGVVFFGGATAGWPGVVHGGCLATVVDESCGRAAFKAWGGRVGLTASLRLRYRAMTLANGFYVVRARPRPEARLPERERGKRHYKLYVDATVEDAVTGKVTVEAEAIFVGGEGKTGGAKQNGGLQWDEKAAETHARF